MLLLTHPDLLRQAGVPTSHVLWASAINGLQLPLPLENYHWSNGSCLAWNCLGSEATLLLLGVAHSQCLADAGAQKDPLPPKGRGNPVEQCRPQSSWWNKTKPDSSEATPNSASLPVLCPLLSFVLLNKFLACDSSSWAQKEGRTEAWALQRFWDIAGGLSGRANTLSRCSFDSFQVFVYKRLEGLNRSWDSNRMSGNGYSGFRVTEVCAQLLMTHMNLKAQSYLTLRDPIDCSPPGSSVHGILQARMLEWVVISFFRGSSQPRD